MGFPIELPGAVEVTKQEVDVRCSRKGGDSGIPAVLFFGDREMCVCSLLYILSWIMRLCVCVHCTYTSGAGARKQESKEGRWGASKSLPCSAYFP